MPHGTRDGRHSGEVVGAGEACLDVTLGGSERGILREAPDTTTVGPASTSTSSKTRAKPAATRSLAASPRVYAASSIFPPASSSERVPWPVARPLSREQVAVHVVGLLEDDGAERVVGEVELGHVDVDELEPGARQPLERLARLEPAPQDEHPDPRAAAATRPIRSPSTASKANRSAGEHAEERRRLLDRTRQRADVVARAQRAGRRRRPARGRTSA